MPFKAYRQTSARGSRNGSYHAGIDLVKLKGGINAPIEAFTEGKVIYAGWGKDGSGLGGYGNVVVVEDKNGRAQIYAHLHSVAVKTGQTIKKGQIVGKQGNTGNSRGAHLHYEVRKTTKTSYGWRQDRAASTLDPASYLKGFIHTQATSSKINLTVDGKWGVQVTRALQIAFGTVVDGILSDQSKNDVTSSLYGSTVQFGTGKKGSLVIKALQKFLNSKGFKLIIDGLLGTATIRALQSYLGTVVDGKLSEPSLVVKELQRRLNAGTFK